MDPTAQTIFSYCVGGLALVSTTASVLFYCRLYLPATQLGFLDELLAETAAIYHKVNDEHLLPVETARRALTRLKSYEDESDSLREVTYRARSCIDTFRTLLGGHTRRIMSLVDEVEDLRATLMTMSQREKARRAQLQALRQTQASIPSELDETSRSTVPCAIDGLSAGSSAHDQPPVFPESIPHFHANQSLPIDIGHSTGGVVLSDPAAGLSSSADGNRHDSPSGCFVCSFVGWCRRKSSPTEISLPSFAARAETESTICTKTNTLSRSSTIIDEPLQKSTSCVWASLTDRTFLCHQATDVIILPTPGEIPQSHHDSATSLPV